MKKLLKTVIVKAKTVVVFKESKTNKVSMKEQDFNERLAYNLNKMTRLAEEQKRQIERI